MSFEYIFILIVAVASISFKPGPGMAAIVSRAIEFGFLSAFMVSMGAIVVELLYFIIAYFGFAFIENYIGSIAIFLKIIGATYLLFLAYQALQKSKKINLSKNQNHSTFKKSAYGKDFMLGFAVTLSNPLVILFYTALIPTILDLSEINVSGLMTALAIIFSVHFLILTSQCVLTTQVRLLLKDKIAVQKFNIISAVLLICVAFFILFSLFETVADLG